MTTPSPLLQLAPELRNHIWELIVTDYIEAALKPLENEATTFLLGSAEGLLHAACPPPISRVNHQIRKEVYPMFYHRSTFLTTLHATNAACFQLPSWASTRCRTRQNLFGVNRWLKSLGDAGRAKLCKIVFKYQTASKVCWSIVLHELIRLFPALTDKIRGKEIKDLQGEE